MRVLVADDESLFRAGLVSLVAERGHEIVGQARDGFEALEQARAFEPDLVLMGVCMPRCDGLEATRLIKAELPSVRIVLVTSTSRGGDLLETLTSGAAGYLLRDRPVEELTHVLDEVAAGSGLNARVVSNKEERCE